VRKELRRWLRRLHDELHITSIFVTHDQEEALEVADRVVLMDHGKVEQIGTPEEVYRHPATPFVYGFLGAVNPFHGHVEGDALRVGDERLTHVGDKVIAFARPHELDILTDAAATDGVPARISRVLSFGVTARVELDGLNGASGQHFEVELTRERVAALALAEGQTVRLQPSRLRVFAR
jgi:sulfate transport system ATP-binding protein